MKPTMSVWEIEDELAFLARPGSPLWNAGDPRHQEFVDRRAALIEWKCELAPPEESQMHVRPEGPVTGPGYAQRSAEVDIARGPQT
jgi:hypothetical protein